jgi:hypothetical protein
MWLFVGLLEGVAIYGAVKGRTYAAFVGVAVVFPIIGIAARKRDSGTSHRAPNEEL